MYVAGKQKYFNNDLSAVDFPFIEMIFTLKTVSVNLQISAL